ncbi:MAG: MFS transporter [Mycobacteriales bacterium]
MSTAQASAAAGAPRARHPGVTLAVIAGAQLMIVLDATIVNIALPHMQHALKFSDTGLTWVLNAYTLTFGGLLLLGGRAGDILGRRRVFMFGIGLFTIASLVGGFAQSSGWLLAARAVQGVGGAIASPTALSLITTNFAEGKERNRAFGVFAAVSGSGAAIGLLLGGMLTQWLSWRWVLFVNAPIGLALILLVPLYVGESAGRPGRFDVTGAITSTAGMTALVYAFIHAAQDSWGDRLTIGAFVAAGVLLAAFVANEMRHRQPVMPMRLFANRNRSSGYVVMLAFGAGMFGMFFFLTLFVQNVLGYSPLKAGLAFVPISFAIGVSAQISSNLMLRMGPKPFMMSGAALSTGGLYWLSLIDRHSGYPSILGPMLLFGFGMGFIFVPLTMIAVSGVRNEDTGAASAMLNVTQQVGGSLGLSILTTFFSSAQKSEQTKLAGSEQMHRFLASLNPKQLADFKAGKVPPPADITNQVLAHGISTALVAAVVLGAIGLALTFLIRNTKASAAGTGGDAGHETDAIAPDAEPAPAPI